MPSTMVISIPMLLFMKLCQPACNPADDDGCDPAYSSVFHGSSPGKKAHPAPDLHSLMCVCR
jgi:hypothetical protein